MVKVLVALEVIERLRLAAAVLELLPENPEDMLDELPVVLRTVLKPFLDKLDLEELLDPVYSIKGHILAALEYLPEELTEIIEEVLDIEQPVD